MLYNNISYEHPMSFLPKEILYNRSKNYNKLLINRNYTGSINNLLHSDTEELYFCMWNPPKIYEKLPNKIKK